MNNEIKAMTDAAKVFKNIKASVVDAKITMLTTVSPTSIAGRVCLNGQEWAVKPFEIAKGASAADKENALLKQAIKEHGE